MPFVDVSYFLIEMPKIYLNVYAKIKQNIFKTIVELIVISKLLLDNKIIALVKTPYVKTCNNIHYFI